MKWMSAWREKGNLFTQSIALVLVSAFLTTSVAFAAPAAETMPKPPAPTEAKASVTDPEKIVVSRDTGILKSKHAGTADKLIIHIQDAHCNYEAQTNIAKLIESFVKNDGLTLVSVEGADGLVDTSWFKAFPDAEIRKEVATYFMKKGEITGPEWLSITTDLPFKLYGAETREYYIQNLNAFTTSYPLKAETEKYYTQIKSVLNKLKGVIFNAGLKELDGKMADYEEKKIPFNDYIRFLQERAEKLKVNIRAYDNFFKLVSVLIYEKKIDFNVVDKERSAVIDALTKQMTKDQVANLVAQSLAFKTAKISSAEFYAYLKALTQQYQLDLAQNYPNLYNYIIYNAVYSRIENERLFSDIKEVEKALKEKLFQNDDQRTLDKLSHHADLLIGLINIKLLNGDYEYYKEHRAEFAPSAFADFIKAKAIQFGMGYELDEPSEAVATAIPKLEDFYAIAIRRDNALVENTLAAMAKEKTDIAVLVTGGFHSEGIARLLEKQGYSYIVICPNITKNEPNNYIQILTNQRTSFEDLLTDTGAVVAQAGTLAPFSMSEGVSLSDEELAQISDAVEGAPLVDRVRNAEAGWINLHVELWLGKAFQYAASHDFSRDPSIFLQAYRIAMTKDVQRLGRDQSLVDQVLASPDFQAAFSAAYSRLAPQETRALTEDRAQRGPTRGPSLAMTPGSQTLYDMMVRINQWAESVVMKVFEAVQRRVAARPAQPAETVNETPLAQAIRRDATIAKLIKNGRYDQAEKVCQLNRVALRSASLRSAFQPEQRKELAKLRATNTARLEAFANYRAFRAGALTPSVIDKMSATQIAYVLRLINLADYPLAQKVLFFSAPPGTGKGTILDATTKGPYKDLIGKLLLYHSRLARNKEFDGETYHFRSIADLERLRDVVGAITTGYVNKQLQAYAPKGYAEESVVIHPGVASEMLRKGDVIIEVNGVPVADGKAYDGPPVPVEEVTKVKRPVSGLDSAFASDKITALEGGYSWFTKFSSPEYGSPDIFTVFLSAYDKDELALRIANQRIIEANFGTPFERLLAYCALNVMRAESKTEKLDLRDTATLNELKSAVVRWKITTLPEWIMAPIPEAVDTAEKLLAMPAMQTTLADTTHLSRQIYALQELKTRAVQSSWFARFSDVEADPSVWAQIYPEFAAWVADYAAWHAETNRPELAKEDPKARIDIAVIIDPAQRPLMKALGRNAADQVSALMTNANLIEGDTFTGQIEHSLIKFFDISDAGEREKLLGDKTRLHMLGYEVQLRLAKDAGRGDTSFNLVPPTEDVEATGIFQPSEDMFNRVVEGVVQYLKMGDYERDGKGAIVVNRFEYDPAKVPTTLQKNAEEFVAAYFKYVMKAIAASQAKDKMTAAATGKTTVDKYLAELEKRRDDGRVKPVKLDQLKYVMSAQDAAEYMEAIKQVLAEKNETKISPEILYEAAARALKGKESSVAVIATLQPGTMNPLHYGHISASIATLLQGQDTDPAIARNGVVAFLANGGTVPDKPYASSAQVRNEMARLAVASNSRLGRWLQVTPIREQVVEMFGLDETGNIPAIAGKDDTEKRALMDMAAFVWLFVANPKVKWVYAVGSDKIAGYNREEVLIRRMLNGHAKILYFERTGAEVHYGKAIAPYPWLKRVWEEGLFVRSSYPSFADLAAVQIRAALSAAEGDPAKRQVGKTTLDEVIPQEVIDYITANSSQGRMLRFLYPLENEQGAADKLVKEQKYDEAIQAYAAIEGKVRAELAKPEDVRAATEPILKSVLTGLAKAQDKARAEKATTTARRFEDGTVTESDVSSVKADLNLVVTVKEMDLEKAGVAGDVDQDVKNRQAIMRTITGTKELAEAIRVYGDQLAADPALDLTRTESLAQFQEAVKAAMPQPGDAITLTGEELTPAQHARVNAIVKEAFTTQDAARQATLAMTIGQGADAVKIFVIPGMASEDDYLIAHPGRGGEAMAHSLQQVYLSPTRFAWVQTLSAEAQKQFWAHEAAHPRLRNESPAITEAEVQALYPIDLVLREAGVPAPSATDASRALTAAEENDAAAIRKLFTGLPEPLQASMAGDYASLRSAVHSLGLVTNRDGRKLILAIDTALDPANKDALSSAARSLETQVNRYLNGAVIEVRGTGQALADRVAQESAALQGQATFIVVTIAGDRTVAAVRQDMLPVLGKVINLDMQEQQSAIKPVPLMALCEFALLLGFADQDTIRLERCLARIMDERENGTTYQEIIGLLVNNEHKIVRILPRLAPVNFNEAREAYKAAQAAAMSL